MLSLRVLRPYRRLCRRFFSSDILQPNILPAEETSDVITTFGPAREVKENLLQAEDLVNKWRTLFYPRAACGSRSYALIGILADLEHAILEYVCDRLSSTGLFTPMEVSDILPLSTTKACGFGDPKNPEVAGHTLQYIVEDKRAQSPELCLSGTAEMGIAHNLRQTMFNELPQYFMAKSRCFRPEVSKSAHESGLYRVHEFNKVEMFAVCGEDQSEKVLSRIVEIQQGIFEDLQIHCRVRDMPANDLSVAAHRKFDIEAWMPGRKIWGEVSSASNCTDFQAKQLALMYTAGDGTPKFVHTCNGTAIATSRALIAVLETHQNPKRKSLTLPECLEQYLPKKRSSGLRLQNCSNFTYE